MRRMVGFMALGLIVLWTAFLLGAGFWVLDWKVYIP